MIKDIEIVLEFDKIKQKIKDFAYSDMAKSKILNLHKLTDLSKLKQNLSETDSAYAYIRNGSNPSFSNLFDIEMHLQKIEKSFTLTTAELLQISNLLTIAEEAIKYYKNRDLSNALDKYFESLSPLTLENNRIKTTIISETEVSSSASSVLQGIRRKKHVLEERINITSNRLLNSYKAYLQEPIIANKDGQICLPVKSEYKNKVAGVVHSVSSSAFTIFIEPQEIISLSNELKDQEALENIEIEKILFAICQSLRDKTDVIRTNLKNLIHLDFVFAKAKYAMHYKHNNFILNTDHIIDLKNAKHPLIDTSICVPLNVTLGREFKSLIITGPNTGGKTVCLKTIGLIELMAMSGLFVPCDENSNISYFKNIFADIGDDQSIEQSLSTFSAHMVNIVDIINNSNNETLCLFDELCTGTDPVEGANLAISILNFLKNKNVTIIATTHYPELKLYALSTKDVTNGSFEFDVETLKPTYKLLIGIPGKSNAFLISKKLGLNDEIISNAKVLLNKNDVRFEDIVTSLEESKKIIENEKLEIEKYKSEITELKEKVKRQQKGLDDRTESILRKAKEEARDILLDAKNIANDTIKNIKNNNLTDTINDRTTLNKKLNELNADMVEKVKGPHQPISPKKINLGKTVKVLSLNAIGTVESLPDKDYNLFVRIGIMKTKTNLRDLEIVDVDDLKIENATIKRTKTSNGVSKIKVEKTMGISSSVNLIGMNTFEAQSVLEKYIDDAYLSNIRSCRVIHGRGTGALRNMVKDYLKNCPYVEEFHYSEYFEGGDGSTEVIFKH